MTKPKTTKQFITEAIKKHGELYDYSSVKYINSRTAVIIKCPIHGPFEQWPQHHIVRGSGCPKCNNIIGGKKRRKTTKQFIKLANKIHIPSYFQQFPEQQNTDSFLYLMEIEGNSEQFIKVEITKQKPTIRQSHISEYNTSIIQTVHMPLQHAYDLEQQILKEFSEHQYLPKLHFSGHTKCLNVDIKPLILTVFNDYINGVIS